jgi:hypothetical protein
MTNLLEQAISKIKILSSNEQDIIATIILEELEEESRWDESFANSSDLLAKLAQEAIIEHSQGKTIELNFTIC